MARIKLGTGSRIVEQRGEDLVVTSEGIEIISDGQIIALSGSIGMVITIALVDILAAQKLRDMKDG